eukprot:5019807-Lingulodinium_polyedra.AAC.1
MLRPATTKGVCVASPQVGRHAADEEDFGGRRLRELREQAGMRLPQTFAGTAHPGPAATWLSKKGR